MALQQPSFLINDMRDVVGNRQPLEQADIGAARIADWNNANGRTQRAECDADSLAEDLHRGAPAQADFQHQPVRADVGYDMVLAKNVGGFQGLERLL